MSNLTARRRRRRAAWHGWVLVLLLLVGLPLAAASRKKVAPTPQEPIHLVFSFDRRGEAAHKSWDRYEQLWRKLAANAGAVVKYCENCYVAPGEYSIVIDLAVRRRIGQGPQVAIDITLKVAHKDEDSILRELLDQHEMAAAPSVHEARMIMSRTAAQRAKELVRQLNAHHVKWHEDPRPVVASR